MPRSIERRIAARGGAVRYRTEERGGKTFRVAVVRNPGPLGGRTVEWEVRDKPRRRGETRELVKRGFWHWFFRGNAFEP